MSSSTTADATPAQPNSNTNTITPKEPSIICIRPKDWSGEQKTYNLLKEKNWQSWCDDIMLTFDVCGLDRYISGTLKCPDTTVDPVGENNWQYNNKYTMKVICDRLSEGQKYHTTNCSIAQKMWSNLVAIHQTCGDQTENQLMHELTEMKVKDGDDIIAHQAKLKKLWDRIILVCPDDLPLPPKLFKKFLTYSLPPSWDDYTRQYRYDPAKKDLNVNIFIGDCMEEYRRHQKHKGEDANKNQSNLAKSMLGNRITKPTSTQNEDARRIKCSHCGQNNHKAENCYHASKPKCTHCKRLGHPEDRCRFKKKNQKSTSQRNKDKRTIAATAMTKKETHATEAGSDDETLTAMDAETSIDAESFMINDPFIDNTTEYDSYLASQASTNDDLSRLYDWLADSGSTNHITNQRKLFTIYKETPGATVHGVGGKITQVIGRGKISLIAQYGTCRRTLHLENVNYIPTNKYNIFALGR
jgi:hypothetical protein